MYLGEEVGGTLGGGTARNQALVERKSESLSCRRTSGGLSFILLFI